MVGSPLSAIRAGIMISLLMLAPVLGRINDRATTLSFALTLILITNPFSAGSVALQLSFGAVAGMFLFSQPIYAYFSKKFSPPRAFGAVWNYIIATLSSSLAVTVFTFPLLAVHFGYITLLAPMMNILCLWAISFLFVGGFAVCAVGLVLSAPASWLAAVLSCLVRYIAFVVEYAAKLPITALYMEISTHLRGFDLICAVYCIFYFQAEKEDKRTRSVGSVPSNALRRFCSYGARYALGHGNN